VEILGAGSASSKLFLRLALAVLPVALAAVAAPAPAAAAPVAGTSSLRVLDIAGVENRTNGKIFAVGARGATYTCSGTAIDTPSRSIVLTAGHCIVEGGVAGRSFTFVPAYDHGARPFGTFTATAAYAMPQWRKRGNPGFDVGAIRVRPNRFGRLGDVTGVRPWTTGKSRFARYRILGYPAGALQGESLRSCDTKGLGSDPLTNGFGGPPTVPGRCDMAGGSSGGAWLVNGYVAGITSYGYTRNLGRLYSPYFGPAVGSFLRGLP